MRDDNAPARPRLTRVVIEEVFGPGSHTLDIPLNAEHRVTILHGRNGSGKTTALRAIHDVLEGAFADLWWLPLQAVHLTFSGGQSLRLLRSQSEQSFLVELELASGPVHDVNAVDLYPTLLQNPESNQTKLEFHWPRELAELIDRVPPHKFITADRLFRREKDAGRLRRRAAQRPTVLALSEQLQREVAEADEAYRELSVRLDATLRRRILQPQPKVPSRDALLARAARVRSEEERLRKLGLLRDEASVEEGEPTDEQLALLNVILTDQEEKLRPLVAIADRAERMLKSLNRTLAPKSIQLDVEHGYRVFNAQGHQLELDQLSSGEQHELVLFHELLFDVPDGSLILIDEPELSLHVTWQQNLLEDLLDIAKLKDLDFVLATHSPYIIHGRDDLMVRLGDPV